MKNKKLCNIDEDMINKIISVAYNDAKLFDKIFIYRLAKHDERVKNLLNSYKSTASEVHKINEKKLPLEVLRLIRSKNTPSVEIKNTFFADLLTIAFARPIASALAAVILITALAVAIVQNRPVKYQYSQAELKLGDQKARQALAIVGKIF